MEQYIVIGKILKAQGVKGEVKIQPITSDLSRFKKLKTVYIDAAAYKITSVRIADFIYMGLAGIETRNDAQSFAGKQIKIDRVNAVELPDDDTFFIVDIEGCTLFGDDGAEIGVVSEVSQFGAADVFTVKTVDKRVMRFPFLKKVIVEVDTENRRIVADLAELEKVSVYED